MNEQTIARENLDNFLWRYIAVLKGSEFADSVDYSGFDEWVEGVTGVKNPLDD